MRLTRKRGLEIVEQGKKQFMAMWEFSNCPFRKVKTLSGDCGYRAGGKRKLNGTDNLNANVLSVNHTKRRDYELL